MNNLNSKEDATIVDGDRKIDNIAANRIGLKSIFCTYGNTDIDYLDSSPSFVVNNTDELFKVVFEFYNFV